MRSSIGTRHRRWALPVAIAAGFAVVGFGVAQSVAAPGSADPAEGESSQIVTGSGLEIPTDSSEFDVDEATPLSEVSIEERLEGTTPLADCPEALEFLERPDVQAAQEAHPETLPGPDDRWAGGCPDIGLLERAYGDLLEGSASGDVG